MAIKLKTYPKYEKVSYGYVDKLPSGWQLLPNIAIFQERIERGYEKEELLSVTIGRGIIKQADLGKKDSSTLDKTKYKLIHEGDLVYSMRFRQGASGYSSYKGIVSPACTVLKPAKNVEYNPRYFYYVFKTEFYKNYVERFAYGIADGQMPLRYTDFKRMYSIVPPIETQNNIVEYLDKKNEEIEKFILQKKKLVKLLEESKKRKIFKILTKGLVENVELVESGFEWIGMVPEHWEMKRIRHFADHVSRGSSPVYVTASDLKVVSQASISSGFIDDSKFKFQRDARIENFKGRLFRGDVLLASTGGGVLGKAIVFDRDGDYIADGHVTIIRDSKKRFNPYYLFYFLSINFKLIEGYFGQGSTNQTELQRNWFRDLFLPYPSIKEQDKIVNYITTFCSDTDSAISKAQKEISAIKEYQDSLITDLVLGKRSVTSLN